MNRLCACLYALLLAVFALSSTANAIEKPNIDLYKGTLNGRVFYDLTLDDVTDMLGRPSTVQETPFEQEKQVSVMDYKNLGIAFFCGRKGSPFKCVNMFINFSNKNILGLPSSGKFQGTISENINKEWKVKRVMEAFKKFNPKLDNTVQDGKLILKNVTVDFKTHRVDFIHEPTTEFLDMLRFVPNKK